MTPAALRVALDGPEELAILDAREEGAFGAEGHLFWAVPCPLSQAELRFRALLPNPGTRVVCCDGGAGEAERLAALLRAAGHGAVEVLEGGAPGWQAAGFELFRGVNVPSKAFGEWVEHRYGTPSVSPEDLAACQARGEDLVILDSRPIDEFERMSIPGGINVPGGELAYRVGAYQGSASRTIVVNCAGRTRSILGAESLRQAGVPNRVVALRNGTMGWNLAGFSCATGATARHGLAEPEDSALRHTAALAFAERHSVRRVDAATAAAWQADRARTTYVLDVRDAAEFAEARLSGSRHAPGGQLVQATDRWIAVRGARILLVDDTETRALMTGAWLRQLGGWEVAVRRGGLAGGRLEAGAPGPTCPEAERAAAPRIEASQLAALLADGAAQVIELTRSIAYRAGHIPGALWGVRTRLGLLASRLAADRMVVLAGETEALARLAVGEVAALAPVPVRVLAGGVAAWRAAGFPLAASPTDPPDEACIDWYLRPYDRNAGVAAAMGDYLDWELALPAAVARDGTARFGAW
jgi:rhodanese-related sulfurtransferase